MSTVDLVLPDAPEDDFKRAVTIMGWDWLVYLFWMEVEQAAQRLLEEENRELHGGC